MGRKQLPHFAGALFHLILPGRRRHELVQDDEDWTSLGTIAKRTLWWCDGAIHACRCDGSRMHFALEVSHSTVGAMSQRISGGYAQYLTRRRAWTGGAFAPYVAIPVDAALYLTDLVVWLHRPWKRDDRTLAPRGRYWTGDDAYLAPGSLTWITTARALGEFGRGAAGIQAYRTRKAQGVDPEIVSLLNRRRHERSKPGSKALGNVPAARPTVEMIREIARLVAEHRSVSYEDMYSHSRQRDVSKAKSITAVLAVRNGASLATVARLFRRRSSTLIEEAEHYRETEPQMFVEAERAIAGRVDFHGERGSQSPSIKTRSSTSEETGRAAARRQ
jgi:hypothetical protein